MTQATHGCVRFVVLFEGRSGSTYLIHALRSHPAVRARGEEIKRFREGGHEAQARWIRGYFTDTPVPGVRAVGFKTKLSDVADRDRLRDLLSELEVRVVHLRRRNVVKQAVSWLNANRLHEATGEWNLFGDDRPLPPSRLEPDRFDEHLRAISVADESLSRYVAGLSVPVFTLSYEALLVKPEVSLTRLLAWLGLEYAPPRVRVRKATPDDLRQALENFEELRARYVDTPYHSMFDEVLDRAKTNPAPVDRGAAGVTEKPKRRPAGTAVGDSPELLAGTGFRRFVIVTQPRSGSTLLQRMLVCHPGIRCYGEVFNPDWRVRSRSRAPSTLSPGDDALMYLEKEIYGAQPPGVLAVGFRLLHEHARKSGWGWLWDHLRSRSVPVIHLTRENLLSRYVSERSGLRSRTRLPRGSATNPPRAQPIRLEPREVLRDFHRQAWWVEYIADFFLENPYLELAYKDLIRQPELEVELVQRFLGVEPRRLTTPVRTRRAGDLSGRISNFDELREAFSRYVDGGWARPEWLGFFEQGEPEEAVPAGVQDGPRRP